MHLKKKYLKNFYIMKIFIIYKIKKSKYAFLKINLKIN